VRLAEEELLGNSQGVLKASEARDVVSVRIEVHAIFLEPARSYSGGEPSENSQG
jgi:hypothetical protein